MKYIVITVFVKEGRHGKKKFSSKKFNNNVVLLYALCYSIDEMLYYNYIS